MARPQFQGKTIDISFTDGLREAADIAMARVCRGGCDCSPCNELRKLAKILLRRARERKGRDGT